MSAAYVEYEYDGSTSKTLKLSSGKQTDRRTDELHGADFPNK